MVCSVHKQLINNCTIIGLSVDISVSGVVSADNIGKVKSLSHPVHMPRRSECRPSPAGSSRTLNKILSRPGLCRGELDTKHNNAHHLSTSVALKYVSTVVYIKEALLFMNNLQFNNDRMQL